jgi:phage terminase small subunit
VAELTQKMLDFARNYVECGRNGSKAYRWSYDAARMSRESIGQEASKLLADPRIAAEVARLSHRAAEHVEFTAADWLRHNVEIATADPNDLIRTRHVCCRHCWGIDGGYQWRDETEFVDACMQSFNEAAKRQREGDNTDHPAPTNEGGYGFDKTRPPREECERCAGEGEWEVFVADTGRLEGAARRLYAGIKQTRNGVEIVMRSQDAALKAIGTYLGLNNLQRHEIAGKDGGPIVTAASLSDEHLAQIISKSVDGAKPKV